jgi:hypothetical protein
LLPSPLQRDHRDLDARDHGARLVLHQAGHRDGLRHGGTGRSHRGHRHALFRGPGNGRGDGRRERRNGALASRRHDQSASAHQQDGQHDRRGRGEAAADRETAPGRRPVHAGGGFRDRAALVVAQLGRRLGREERRHEACGVAGLVDGGGDRDVVAERALDGRGGLGVHFVDGVRGQARVVRADHAILLPAGAAAPARARTAFSAMWIRTPTCVTVRPVIAAISL